MSTQLTETETVTYQVIVNGAVLNESASVQLAKSFVLQLTPEQRAVAQIVPIVESGKQILLG